MSVEHSLGPSHITCVKHLEVLLCVKNTMFIDEHVNQKDGSFSQAGVICLLRVTVRFSCLTLPSAWHYYILLCLLLEYVQGQPTFLMSVQ